MQSDVSHSAGIYEGLAWLEQHKKQVAIGVGAAALLTFIVCLMVYLRGEKVVTAGQKLSDLQWQFSSPQPHPDASQAYLKLSGQYSSTPAGAQALLLGAGALFDEGKFPEALAEFQRFIRDYQDNPFSSQAYLGLAACYDAQGKTSEAISAYSTVINNHKSEAVLPQANFALGRLYMAQKTSESLGRARNCFAEVAKLLPRTPLGQEAQLTIADLEAAHPELAPKPPASLPPGLSLPRTPGP